MKILKKLINKPDYQMISIFLLFLNFLVGDIKHTRFMPKQTNSLLEELYLNKFLKFEIMNAIKF